MTLQFLLVPPVVWRPLVHDWFAALNNPEIHLARSILVSLHDLHVGITPRLCASLARSLISGLPVAPWDGVFDHLRRIYANQGELPLLPERAFDFVVLELVRPLIQHACEDVGSCMLFAEDDIDAAVRSDVYAQYDQDIFVALERAIQRPDEGLPPLFWQERSLRLASTAAYAPQPDFSLMDIAIFTKLRPAMRSRRENALNLYIPQQQRLRDERRPGAGADGLMLTRREEDIHRMHLSEHVYPQALRMDRVFNTGYAIVKPPPQPVRQRDTLMLTISYGGTADTFLRTCYADFALYLTRMFGDGGRHQLRWIEGDRFQRVRSLTMRTDQLTQRLPVEIEPEDLPDYRLRFLEAAGWLPAYLDAAAATSLLNDQPLKTLDWLRTVWSLHTDPLHANPTDVSKLRLDDYQFVFVMLFLPAVQRNEDPYQIQRFQDLLGVQVNGLSVTWVPSDIRDAQGWSVSSDRRAWQPDPDTEQLRIIAGGLIDAWLDSILYEMRHV